MVDVKEFMRTIGNKRRIFNDIENMTDEEFNIFFINVKKMIATVIEAYPVISKRLGLHEKEKLDNVYAVLFDMMAALGIRVDNASPDVIEESIDRSIVEEYKSYVRPTTEDFTNENYKNNQMQFKGKIFVKIIKDPQIKFISTGAVSFYATRGTASVRVPPSHSKDFNGYFTNVIVTERTTDKSENPLKKPLLKKNKIYECVNPIIVLKNPDNEAFLEKNVYWECKVGKNNIKEIRDDIGSSEW